MNNTSIQVLPFKPMDIGEVAVAVLVIVAAVLVVHLILSHKRKIKQIEKEYKNV